MPKVTQKGLSDDEIVQFLQRLQDIGQDFWQQNWRESMALPEDLPFQDHEAVTRFLLLRALLNQQGDTSKVRELVRALFDAFGQQLLDEPLKVTRQFREMLTVFYQVGGEKGAKIYHVGALGGIKPLSLFLYRFAAFAFFVSSLHQHLCEIVKDKLQQGVHNLWAFFRDDPILNGGWVGNDPKAVRMLTNWLVWLFGAVWQKVVVNLEETLMVVDGHVGKVFCRAGAVKTVVHESKRPFIIVAKDMRNEIEALVKGTPQAIPMFVDEGAFAIAMRWCFETKPNCSECPIQKVCLAGCGSTEHLRWSAYRRNLP